VLGFVSGAVLIPWLVDRGLFPLLPAALFGDDPAGLRGDVTAALHVNATA
jgi:hypothetical protein